VQARAHRRPAYPGAAAELAQPASGSNLAMAQTVRE